MSLYFQWGGCFAALLVEGPWCNPWISGEPNHLENNFPGSSERNRKRTTPSEILNDAIDEKNPPLVCRIPSAVSIVWWLLCSSAKVYLYISHLPWICSRKFGNSSKNTSYQMMIKHGDQIHKRIPKNSTLRQKTRHQGTEQGGSLPEHLTPLSNNEWIIVNLLTAEKSSLSEPKLFELKPNQGPDSNQRIVHPWYTLSLTGAKQTKDGAKSCFWSYETFVPKKNLKANEACAV